MVEFTSLGFNQPNQCSGILETEKPVHPASSTRIIKKQEYSVKHKCNQSLGEDSIVKQDLIVITRPDLLKFSRPLPADLHPCNCGIYQWHSEMVPQWNGYFPILYWWHLTTPYLNSSKIIMSWLIILQNPSMSARWQHIENGGFFTVISIDIQCLWRQYPEKCKR
jgi:hypothetical protein